MIATIFDTETTNLIDNHVIKLSRQPHVIEFYGCSVDLVTGQVHRELEHLIRPPDERDINLEVSTKSHGITWDMVRDKPRFAEVAEEIFSLVSSNETILAHNLSFDMEILDLEAERLGKKIAWPGKRICTLEQTTWLRGQWLSLTDLHEYLFSTKFDGTHRAKNDVTALVRCCVSLHDKGWI